MATTVVMSPGWGKKVLAKADKHVAYHTARVETGVHANIMAARLIRTGALYRSVRSTYEGVAHRRVWIGTDHWAPLEYGARPHLIRPRGPWPLRFRGRDGSMVRTFLVRHPGNREYAVVRRALWAAAASPF